MHSHIIFLFTCLSLNAILVDSLCSLPTKWYGRWYQGKYTDLKTIDKTNFINRGECMENQQDKYIFYEKNENCYRCLFIMQKHSNVLQYRASYCTEDPDFYANCNNLTPESELVTIYRHNSVPEKCPLGGLYVMSKSSQTNTNPDTRSYRNTNAFDTYEKNDNKECTESNKNKNSMIMECSDNSMMKLQFGKCANIPTFIVQCTAHWTEGNTNYLIGKVFSNETQRSSYRCLAYTELASQEDSPFTYSREQRHDPDFIDLSYQDARDSSTKTTLQIYVSQDEFCRNIDNVLDEQFSFSFTKVLESTQHVIPAITHKRSAKKRQLDSFNTLSSMSIKSSKKHFNRNSHGFKFPRWLNKKWRNLKQTKLFMLDYHLDSLLILDEKNSVVINKYNCESIKAKTVNLVQAVVKSLNGCSTGFQCLTIRKKSDFVLEIKFGKINYDTPDIDCDEMDAVSQEFVFVDTAYGVTCPLKPGLYEKLDSKTNNLHKALLLQEDSKHTLYKHEPKQQEPCKYLTQTQTLQVSCQNDQQYSLRTKLCYPNQQGLGQINDPIQNTQYTQIESEINLVCLAHWRHEGNQVIVSRTMSNEILCSIWSSSYDGKFLQLLSIDSNCNYEKISDQSIDYGFIFLNNCDSNARYSSSSFSSSSILGGTLDQVITDSSKSDAVIMRKPKFIFFVFLLLSIFFQFLNLTHV